MKSKTNEGVPQELRWKVRKTETGHEWTAETHKWEYSIELGCDKQGHVWFEASRMSTNFNMGWAKTGELLTKCKDLPEATRIANDWHVNRYDDNEVEFIEEGGSDEDVEKKERKSCRAGDSTLAKRLSLYEQTQRPISLSRTNGSPSKWQP